MHTEPLLDQLRTAAATAHAQALPDLPFSQYRRFADDGNRLAYEALYFRRRAHVLALAAEPLTDPSAPTDDLADALWSVCDEYTWALPAHDVHATSLGRGMEECLDLFAALTAHLMAETVQVCGSRLDGRVAARVREQVDRRVLALLADDERPLPWESWAHNWAAVCAGATGLAALALWQPGPRLDRLLDRCRRAMHTYLRGFGDDGGCAEGVGYWVFGFSHYVYFAEELREQTGEDLLADPRVAAIARFPASVHLGGGLFPAFSDGEERPRVPAGLAYRLAQRFGVRIPAEAIDTGVPRDWGDLSRTLRWAGATGATAPDTGPPPSATWLPDLAWIVDGASGAAFAAKGGHNDEPHNHNDLGHFILAAQGEVLLTDLGAGEYQKGYFDAPTRYDFLHNSSRGHSVPRVDGHEQSYGAPHAAQVLNRQLHADGADFALDLTRAYAVEGLVRLRRTFSWRRGAGELLLVDEVETNRPMPLEEVFVSRLRPQPAVDGGVVWQGEKARARLSLPPGSSADIDTVPAFGHDGLPDTVYRLRVAFGLGVTTQEPTRLRFAFTVG
jgi:hypothetical protein